MLPEGRCRFLQVSHCVIYRLIEATGGPGSRQTEGGGNPAEPRLGKAPQQLDVSSADGGPVWSEVFKTWSTDDLRAALRLLEGNVDGGQAEPLD